MQPVKEGNKKIEQCMCARLCISADLPIKHDGFHHAASCRTVALAHFSPSLAEIRSSHQRVTTRSASYFKTKEVRVQRCDRTSYFCHVPL